MRHIRFGNQEVWAQMIASTVDCARFQCQFGDLREADFANFDCVVPLSLPDYDVLQINMGFFGKNFWRPNPGIVNICDDKLVLNRLLLGGEFAEFVPPLRASKSSEFPYIVKKRRDAWGTNSFIVQNSEDERAMDSILQSPEYFCQTYICGTEEYALHVLLVHDEVAYAQTVKYEFGSNFYVRGQNSKPGRRSYLPDSEHIATFSRMLVALGYTGTCCINYKMNSGLPMLLEINPRFGSSLTDDINRYLEAYLGSLGGVDKMGFQNCNVPHASDKSLNFNVLTSMRWAARWLRSRMPFCVWQFLRATRDTWNSLRTTLKALSRRARD